jgi:hypothetical protein
MEAIVAPGVYESEIEQINVKFDASGDSIDMRVRACPVMTSR